MIGTFLFVGLDWTPSGELLTLDHRLGKIMIFSPLGKLTGAHKFGPFGEAYSYARPPRFRFLAVIQSQATLVVSDLGLYKINVTPLFNFFYNGNSFHTCNSFHTINFTSRDVCWDVC